MSRWLRGVTNLSRWAAGLCLLFLALSAVFVPVASAGAAQTSSPQGGVGLAPTPPSKTGWLTANVAPGQTWTGVARVSNPSTATINLALYPVDGLTSPDTGLAFNNQTQKLRPATTKLAEGSWVTLSTTSAHLTAGQSQKVNITVTVPPNAQPGQHVAGIAAQNLATSTSGSHGVSVKAVERVVMAIVVMVPSPTPLAFNLQMKTPTISAAGADQLATVKIPMTDTGSLYTKPHIKIQLTDKASKYSKTLTNQYGTVLPGDPITLPITWPDNLPSGTYHVTVLATWANNGTAHVADTVTIGTPLTGYTHNHTAPATVTKSTNFILILAASIGLLVILSVIAIVMWSMRRRPVHAAAHAPGGGSPHDRTPSGV